MSRKRLLIAIPVGCLALLPLTANRPEPVGAPWVSLEVPANPMDPETRDAAFVVHAYYHQNPARYPASGTAEGLVDGKRVSLPLELTATSRPGVYAVRKQWADEGHWVVSVGINAGGDGPTLLVGLGPSGGSEDTGFYGPHAKVVALRSVRVVPGKVDAVRIDATLRTMAMR